MAQLVITGTAGNATFEAPIASMQGTADQYWTLADVDGKEYGIEKYKAPGQGGHAVKRHGFETRVGFAIVIYVAASAAACRTARTTDEGNMLNQKVSVAVPDGPTLTNAEVTKVKLIKGPKKTETGNYRYQLRIEFEEVRE